MRIVITLLLAAVVLQSVFAVTSKANQAKLMIEKINNKLEKSHLGRALKNMVTLATKLGYNYDDLTAAFDALKGNLLAKKQDETELYESQKANHADNVQTHESSISHYESEIKDGEAQLFSEESELATQKENLDNAHQFHDKTVASHKKATEDLSVLEANYEYEVEQFRQADSLIGEAVEHLEVAQQHYESGELETVAFVQIKSNFVSFAQKLTLSTSKLSAKHQLFIKPVIQAMSQIKSNSKSSSIQVAIDALKELKAYFQKALEDATNVFLHDQAFLQGQIHDFEESIRNYEDVVIPNLEEKIRSIDASIVLTHEWLDNSHKGLAEAHQALDDEHANFEKITQRHEALIARVDSEYNLVSEAERIISDAQKHLEA